MADIEVVIKIDEDIYNRFTHNEVRPRFEITEEERFQMDADAVRLTRAFCNGTPLPEGHWIYDDEYSDWVDVTYQCSCCKRAIIVPYEARNEVYKDYPYCHCGAKMAESEE